MVSLLSIALLFSFGSGTLAAQQCRCQPGESCWPSASTFASFEKNLTNPLIPLQPVLTVCHPANSSSYNQSACDAVQAVYNTPQYRTSQPAALQFITWENLISSSGVSECPSNVSIPCSQGRVPAMAINVSSVSDIQQGIAFANLHNLKLVVKNSGHENLGRSAAKGALSLWTVNLKGSNFSDSFVPVGAPEGTPGIPAITIAAGMSWGEVYDAANASGYNVVGGIGAGGTVGAGGGWINGAGHSILSPFFGLGIDNVLEQSVVLPNGTYITVSQYQHPEIAWALRGGGGPSFGVLITTTYKAHKSTPFTAGFFQGTAKTNASRKALLGAYINASTSVADGGWGGFWPFNNDTLYLTLLAQNYPPTNPNANSSLEAFFDAARKIPDVNVSLAETVRYPTFLQWYHDNFINTENAIGYNYTLGDYVGVNAAAGSRLLPRSVFESNQSALIDAVANLPGGRPFSVGGGAVSSANASLTSTTPAWRSCLVDMTLGITWDPSADYETITADRATVNSQLVPLRDLTPGGGTYLNEPEINEPNWQQAYWGDANYAKLLTIKKSIDPEDTFIVRQGVNSEAWDGEVICKTV